MAVVPLFPPARTVTRVVAGGKADTASTEHPTCRQPRRRSSAARSIAPQKWSDASNEGAEVQQYTQSSWRHVRCEHSGNVLLDGRSQIAPTLGYAAIEAAGSWTRGRGN